MHAFLATALAAPAPAAKNWAVIFDAGSTGTRVHCFQYSAGGGAGSSENNNMPDVEEVPGGRMKVTPGISSFEPKPESAGASLTPLLELAERVIPASEHSRTLVMLRATAGMRLLSKRRAQREVEDRDATCCAIQNLCLALWAEGVGTKWTSGAVTRSAEFRALCGIGEDEAVVGVVWYGLASGGLGAVRESPRKLAVDDVLSTLP